MNGKGRICVVYKEFKVFSVSEQRDVVTGVAKIVCGRAGSIN